MSEQQELEDGTERTLCVTIAQDADFHGPTLSAVDTNNDSRRLRDSYLLTLESERDLARVFSPKRLDLLRAIRRHDPGSMRETARLVDRDIKTVSRSLNQLEEIGVVEFEQRGRAKRPIVAFDEIDITVGLDQKDTDIDPTSAQALDVPTTDGQDTASQSTTALSGHGVGVNSNFDREPTPVSSKSQKSSESRDMPDGHFTEIEFPRGPSGDRFFNNVHDPHLVYDFVRLLHDRLEHGITDSASIDFESGADDRIGREERRMNAEIYTKVEILRGTMQYVEEFGIYFAAYLCDDRPLASNLIDTKVSHFFEVFDDTDRTVGRYLAERGVDEDYNERLRAVFGYRDMLDLYSQDVDTDRQTELAPTQGRESSGSQTPDENQTSGKHTLESGNVADAKQVLTRNEAEVVVDASLEALRSRIETIARFYLEFRDLYNAVKHGTRIIPLDGFEIETDLAEDTISVNEQYVAALCKTSGTRDGGRPYFLHYPADRLVSRSRHVLERTHGLFEYLRRLHRDDTEDEADDREGIVRFFALTSRVEDDDTLQRVLEAEASSELDSDPSGSPGAQTALESGKYIQIGNADFKTFIPQSASFREPTLPTFAARFSLNGGTLTIETELDEELSERYPVMMTYRPKYGTGARLSLRHKLSMNADLTHLDFTQYQQLLKIEEAGKKDALDYVEIDIQGGGDNITEPFVSGEWSMNVPETSFGRELIAFLARLELITQRRVPIPMSVSDEQLNILRSERGSVDTRADAQSVLDLLEASGDGAVYTHVSVERDRDGELHHLTVIPGTPTPTVTLLNGETRSVEDLLDGNRGSISLRFEGFPGTPEWFVEYLRENPDAVRGIFDGSVPGDENSDEQFAVVFDLDLHVQTFWYDESQVTIRAESMGPHESDTEGGKSQ